MILSLDNINAHIIVENRNPLLETIIADFENTAQALTEGKP